MGFTRLDAIVAAVISFLVLSGLWYFHKLPRHLAVHTQAIMNLKLLGIAIRDYSQDYDGITRSYAVNPSGPCVPGEGGPFADNHPCLMVSAISDPSTVIIRVQQC